MTAFPKKAMILAAGLGERLKPLTLHVPKPLIPVAGRPLIEYNLCLLRHFGIREVVLNLFHLGEKIREVLGQGQHLGMKIEYSQEKILLGTGGGLKAAAHFFGKEDFFVMNGDILVDVDLNDFFSFHQKGGFCASLVVSPFLREEVRRKVFVGATSKILGIEEQAPALKSTPTVFTGLQILGKKVLDTLPPAQSPSCLIGQAYLPLLQQQESLGAYLFKGYWRDLGTLKRYEEVQREFQEKIPYTILREADFTSS